MGYPKVLTTSPLYFSCVIHHMHIHADLHAHSAFAGGARAGGKSPEEQNRRITKRFQEIAVYSPLKGVDILGTGDIQYEPWLAFIEERFEEVSNGIYCLSNKFTTEGYAIVPEIHDYPEPHYVLQTELILSGPLLKTGYKKLVHIVILFPYFEVVRELNDLLDQWGVARANMARPFIVCDTREQVSKRLSAIMDIHPLVEIIPAHVLTPQGIYGGNLRVNAMEDYFGSATERINAIETGLSADPQILYLIPELDDMTLISNADAHSAKLNRIGREFTTLEVGSLDYPSLIKAIRNNKVVKTAEFHPTEGRYFLTGHRSGRKKPGIHRDNQFCCFSPKNVPENDICPQCGGELTIGVLQRAFEIGKAQGDVRNLKAHPNDSYVTMVPLIEIVAKSLDMKTITAKRVESMYSEVLEVVKTEVNLWLGKQSIQELHGSDLPEILVKNISQIKAGKFSFFPGGYDGVYGELQIGRTLDFENISVIKE